MFWEHTWRYIVIIMEFSVIASTYHRLVQEFHFHCPFSWTSYRNSSVLWFLIRENFNFTEFYRFYTSDGPVLGINWLKYPRPHLYLCYRPLSVLNPSFIFFIFFKLYEKLFSGFIIPCFKLPFVVHITVMPVESFDKDDVARLLIHFIPTSRFFNHN